MNTTRERPRIAQVSCSKCGNTYEVNLEELPIDEDYARDICPICDDDGWKLII